MCKHGGLSQGQFCLYTVLNIYAVPTTHEKNEVLEKDKVTENKVLKKDKAIQQIR